MSSFIKYFAYHPLTRGLCCTVEDLMHRYRHLGTSQRRRQTMGALSTCNDTDSCIAFAQTHNLGPTQIATEIDAFLKLVESRQVRIVLEIGTARGGTTFLFGHLLRQLELLATVDLVPRHPRLLRDLFSPRLEFHAISGSSYAPSTVEKINQCLRGRKIDLLFIDGDHRYEGVAADFKLYSPLVASDGLIAVHDIVPSLDSGNPIHQNRWVGGVPQFWQELRPQAREYWEFVAHWKQNGFGIGVVSNRDLTPCIRHTPD